MSPGWARAAMLTDMPVTERRIDRGSRLARELHRRLAQELRSSRIAAGLSQRHLAGAAGIAHTTVQDIENATASATTLDTYARLFALLGGRLSVKVYPEGPPIHDQGQNRLLHRLRGRLHPAIGMGSEVGLGIVGDLRAWDAELRAGGETMPLDAETVLSDLQALERRIALKARDSGATKVILLVADTARNRRVLRESGSILADRFPLGTRAALRYLAAGRLPPRGAIIVL